MAFAKSDRNISIGVFLLVALGLFLAGFIFYIVASNQRFFQEKYTLYMYLPNAQGLTRGAFVALSGLKVGVVGDMKIVTEEERQGVVIELKVDEDYSPDITTSSVAQIKTMGILGDKYVDITIGQPEEPALIEGEFIKSDPGVDPYEFFDDAAEIVTDFKSVLKNTDSLTTLALRGDGMVGKLFADQTAGRQFGALVSNLQQTSGKIARGEGTIGRMMQDTTLYARLDRSSRNLQAILDSLHTGKGMFARLLSDSTFYPRLKAISVKTDSLLYRLQHGGTAARLLKDEQLYLNLSNLSRSLDSLVTDMKKRPGRYVKFELF